MDRRRALHRGSVLEFPGMACCVEEVLGSGSNAIVYRGWYQDNLHAGERHRVLIKELFPYEAQGRIWRGPDGRIYADEGEPMALFLLHRESFEAGNRIHLRLLEGCPEGLGANLNTFELNGTLYTVLGYAGGRTLEEELMLRRGEGNLRSFARLMLTLLDALRAFHDSGYLHLDVSPDNAMLLGPSGGERIMLIDYNSARRIGQQEDDYLSFKEGYSAPELYPGVGDSQSICEASDLYSVAAVFYRCLMDRPLTLEETLECIPPDAGESPCLRGQPQTVVSHVGSILRRGLRALPEERYRTIEEMRRDFAELLDRIDCVGVTHWALWESGRRSIEELIRVNPSLSYVRREQGMYPIRIEQDGRLMSFDAYIGEMVSPQGVSRLTVSPGGMGKTTLLLRTALVHGRRFSPAQPAILYISLAGWAGTDAHGIRSRILMGLRFGREANTFDSALHELEQLLTRPIRGRDGELPVLLLLLDGLNEIRGDAAPLMQEIDWLSHMAGVRIMAASRSEIPALGLATNRVLGLTGEDVAQAAAARGVLLPQSEAVARLLRTPLLLSIYLSAAESTQLLQLRNQDDLMQAYMEALYRKEIQGLPESSPQRWQADAALTYVLPAIAARAARAGHTLTEKQLLGVVEQCYAVLSSRMLQQAFPQWIGHSRDILGSAHSAEEWYGLMVHDLLWQRLGLLMKDGQDGYSVFHQLLEEYLARQHRRNATAIRKRRLLRASALTAALLMTALLVLGVYAACFMDWAYISAEAEDVLCMGLDAYGNYMVMYGKMDELLSIAEDGLSAEKEDALDAFEEKYKKVQRKLHSTREDQLLMGGPSSMGRRRVERETLERIVRIAGQARRVVPWSGKPLDAVGIAQIYSYVPERRSYYVDVLLPELREWYTQTVVSGDGATERARLCLQTARQMLAYDAQICQLMYNLYLSGHMNEDGLRNLEVISENGLDAQRMAALRADVSSYSEPDEEKLLAMIRVYAIQTRESWRSRMNLFQLMQ